MDLQSGQLAREHRHHRRQAAHHHHLYRWRHRDAGEQEIKAARLFLFQRQSGGGEILKTMVRFFKTMERFLKQ